MTTTIRYIDNDQSLRKFLSFFLLHHFLSGNCILPTLLTTLKLICVSSIFFFSCFPFFNHVVCIGTTFLVAVFEHIVLSCPWCILRNNTSAAQAVWVGTHKYQTRILYILHRSPIRWLHVPIQRFMDPVILESVPVSQYEADSLQWSAFEIVWIDRQLWVQATPISFTRKTSLNVLDYYGKILATIYIGSIQNKRLDQVHSCRKKTIYKDRKNHILGIISVSAFLCANDVHENWKRLTPLLRTVHGHPRYSTLRSLQYSVCSSVWLLRVGFCDSTFCASIFIPFFQAVENNAGSWEISITEGLPNCLMLFSS